MIKIDDVAGKHAELLRPCSGRQIWQLSVREQTPRQTPIAAHCRTLIDGDRQVALTAYGGTCQSLMRRVAG